ncbi:MAG: ATP-binding cassette domain-containing protein, partial [Clostridia bacterium]|nr:ATP-binding cassette domain-containing protein [Clostridia bacterium]
VDIDYTKIKMYVGNYDFWYHSSQLMQRLLNDQNKKREDKIKELQTFIERFSAHKSKAKQATARRKLLDKLTVEEMPASSRKYPFVVFNMDREAGKEILWVEGISKTVNGVKVLNNVSFRVNKGDKIAFVGDNEIANTTLFQILMGEMEPDEGSFKWGVSTTQSYFRKDSSEYFDNCELSIIDWLAQYAPDALQTTLRGFLGKMLFSGDDVLKPVNVLSGGEKVRCMLSRMMMFGSNVLVMDQPTNHLDLESITAVNDGLIAFKGNILFASHDHQFIQTVADRIIEIMDEGCIDRMMCYDDYIEARPSIVAARKKS